MSAESRRSRGARGIWPGVVAAVLWWGVNALDERLTYASTVPASFAQLVLPAAVPGFTWVTPQPWPVLAPALAALAVGALTVLGCRLLRRPGLVSVWFVAIVASVIIGIALGLGLVIADWPPARTSMVLVPFPERVQAAALWGVAWGWLPALAARPASATGRGAQVLPAAMLAVVFTVLAVLGQASAQLPTPTGAATPVPTPTAPATPIPTAAAGAASPDPDWCSPTQVELSLGGESAATGHRALTITATNRTGVDCLLDGYPDLAFGDARNSLLSMHTVRGSSFAAQDPGPSEVRLGAGQSATSTLGWDAPTSDPAHQVHLIAVAPYPGAPRTMLPADVDLISGSDVGYTAWQAAPATTG